MLSWPRPPLRWTTAKESVRVLAAAGSSAGPGVGSGWVFTDDEDNANANSLACGAYCGPVSAVVSGGRDTKLNLARVR